MAFQASLVFKAFFRDFRAGELNLLGAALIVAVAALTSVGFLADRVSRGLEREANQLLGGDVLLIADHPWKESVSQTANTLGLSLAQTILLNSMASAGERTLMVGLKAASPTYPLRGGLKIRTLATPKETTPTALPGMGEVWLDERAMSALNLKLGDTVDIGYASLKLTAQLTFESDRGSNMFSLAPRALIALEQLPASGLLAPGARATWRLHAAGDEAKVREFETWVKPQLGRGERVENIENARPEVRSMLDAAQRFLRLAAVLCVILAAVAIGLAAQRFMRRHLDACAILRCLGAQQQQLVLIFVGEFIFFGVICALLGAVLGGALQWTLGQTVAQLVGARLPAPSLLPVAHGLGVTLVLLLGFVLPELLRLAKVPTLRVLRREIATVAPVRWTSWLLGAGALVGIIFWIAQDVRLGSLASAGFALTLLISLALSGMVLLLIAKVRQGVGAGWRYGLAALTRRKLNTMVQMSALSLGLMSVLLLTFTRADLIQSWEKSAPAGAPNRFIINIQPDQTQGITDFFKTHGLPPPVLQSTIRGRLLAINGQPVQPEIYESERTRRLAEREFNLSAGAHLPETNEITQGQWHGESTQPQWSVEKGFAETFKLKLGDVVRFDIAGTPAEAPITSIRRLDWNSMRVNFFFIASPGLLNTQLGSLITSFHLPVHQASFTAKLVETYPNLTVIDVTAILAQLKDMVDKLSFIVQLIFGFALIAGGVVLYAALQSTHDERQLELAVLRTLGARNAQIRQALYAEFAVIGAFAGLLAGLGATALGWALATQLLKISYSFSPWVCISGLLAGTLGTLFAGALGTRKLLTHAPLNTLRALG